MAAKFQAPRGTCDVLPDVAVRHWQLTTRAREILENGGYRQIDTPIFEETALFARGVGEATDIVSKEMYTFDDRGGRSLTLRPEGTASVSRAFIERGMHKLPQPVKLWYTGPMFRYESPQSGRYRQHYQIGVEAFGSAEPLLDAELIALEATLYRRLGLKGVKLALSSMGDSCCRPAYLEELKRFFQEHSEAFSEEQRRRIEVNPMRAFDWQEATAREVTQAAPKLLERLCSECAAHLESVRRALEAGGVEYALDGRLVRGLDYYTRTVFEFSSDQLGAQSGIGGGGRYDRLVELLGGPATPAAGWATGVERILLALEAGGKDTGPQTTPELLLGARDPSDDEASVAAFAQALKLRDAGVRTELDTVGRSLKAQLKHSDRLGSASTASIYYLESRPKALLKDMRTGEQEDDIDLDQLVERVKKLLEGGKP